MYKSTSENYEYVKKITDELLSETFYNNDWEYVQRECLKYIENEYLDIVHLAITCLGHLARIHKCIDKEKILLILKEKAKDNKLTGVVEDALDDIKQFTE